MRLRQGARPCCARVRLIRVLIPLLLCLVPGRAAADVITTWMAVADYALGKAWEGSFTRTAQNTRLSAQVALAMYEAVNAVDRRYTPFLGTAKAPAGASLEGAAAHAAHAVLVALLPDQRRTFDEALVISRHVAAADSAAWRLGAEVGAQAAAAVLARAALAENTQLQDYRPRTAPGAYIDPRLPSILPFDVVMPPFTLKTAADVRPVGPPPLASERYARDLEEVRRLGAKVSSERTEAMTLMADALLNIDYQAMLAELAARPGRTVVQNARMFALVHVVMEDAWLAIMDAKMHFGTWRPITAIRNADEDDNDGTTRDPAWEPLLRTPTHPDYPCGHCGTAAALATVLEAETGAAPPGGILMKSYEHSPGLVLRVATWQEFVDAMSMSRIYSGAHTRFANDDAEAMGREVARRALAGFMRPLD